MLDGVFQFFGVSNPKDLHYYIVALIIAVITLSTTLAVYRTPRIIPIDLRYVFDGERGYLKLLLKNRSFISSKPLIRGRLIMANGVYFRGRGKDRFVLITEAKTPQLYKNDFLLERRRPNFDWNGDKDIDLFEIDEKKKEVYFLTESGRLLLPSYPQFIEIEITGAGAAWRGRLMVLRGIEDKIRVEAHFPVTNYSAVIPELR